MTSTASPSSEASITVIPAEQTGTGAGAIDIDVPACRARIELHGGQIVSWQPTGERDVLWLSPTAHDRPGKGIRGGIPVCAPWFAQGPSGDQTPNHGPARTQAWRLDAHQVREDGQADVRMSTTADGVDLALAIIAGDRLTVDLTLGLPPQAEPRQVEAALHSYLAVRDVRNVSIEGLTGVDYFDKVTGEVATQQGQIHLQGFTDRIYRSAPPLRLVDTLGERTLAIQTEGSSDTVVWNPWAEGAGGFDDIPAQGWSGFVCVEAACIGAQGDQVDHSIALSPGGHHTFSLTYDLI